MDNFHQQLGRPPPSLGYEDVRTLSTPSSQMREIQLLKHEVAVWKSAHNDVLKTVATLESKNYELRQMIQNDVQKLRNEVSHFENEALNHQVQMGEQSTILQMQGVRDAIDDAEKSHLKQTIAELMATVAKQRETIADMERKQDVDRQSFDAVKKSLESNIAALELKKGEDLKAREEEKKSFEAKIVELKQQTARLQSPCNALLIDNFDEAPVPAGIKRVVNSNATTQSETSEPLVIKKLVKVKTGTSWNAFLTLDEDVKPLKIRCDENNNLFLNEVKSNRKLILDGAISYFDSDPWIGNADSVKNDAVVFPGLLQNVLVWKITDLFLHWKNLRWNTFKNIAAPGTIKNLYFTDVLVTDTNNALIPLENIMEMLPNIEKFRYDVVGDKFYSVNMKTSKNLAKLPCFEHLKVFQLYNIDPFQFDPNNFLVFMKKHSYAHFTLSFRSSSLPTKLYLLAIKNQMLKSCPYMLKFKY